MPDIHVTVAAIIKHQDKFLLVEEKASNGNIVFNQPAGHLEANESLIEAVVREVKEETGLEFSATALLGIYLLSPASNGKIYLRFCFIGEVGDPEKSNPIDPDIIATHWLSLEQIKTVPLRTALVLDCINDYLAGQSYPLSSLSFSSNESQLSELCYTQLFGNIPSSLEKSGIK